MVSHGLWMSMDLSLESQAGVWNTHLGWYLWVIKTVCIYIYVLGLKIGLFAHIGRWSSVPQYGCSLYGFLWDGWPQPTDAFFSPWWGKTSCYKKVIWSEHGDPNTGSFPAVVPDFFVCPKVGCPQIRIQSFIIMVVADHIVSPTNGAGNCHMLGAQMFPISFCA